MASIEKAETIDVRFDLEGGVGSDAVHTNPQYGYAVTCLQSSRGRQGVGLTYTLGGGTNIVCQAIELFAPSLIGRDIEELMSAFGEFQHSLTDHHQYRWLGPHKGVVHLAVASITNACFDLWAKKRGLPLWKLLLALSPEQVVALVDWSYLEDVITREEARDILEKCYATRTDREHVLHDGYPGYDTSVGWFHYSDEQIAENVRRTMDNGFAAMKLKVGSTLESRDVRRANLVREVAGPGAQIALDANQAWSLPTAKRVCEQLRAIDPLWIEEPTHPDDILGHRELARLISPVPIAVGETVSNRVMWKNLLLSDAVGIVQADCTRLAGISEYLAVAIMAKKFSARIVPHIGDMGQIHQHLVLFNRIALDHEKLFLEYIPHLRQHFVHPATVENGAYHTPMEPGCSSDLWITHKRATRMLMPKMHAPFLTPRPLNSRPDSVPSVRNEA